MIRPCRLQRHQCCSYWLKQNRYVTCCCIWTC